MSIVNNTIKEKGKVKFSMRIEPDCFKEELEFASHLGVDGVYCWVRDDQTDTSSIARIRERVEKQNLKLFTVHNYKLSKSSAIQLNLPERDAMIEKYREFIFNLSNAGVYTTNFTWEPIKTQYWNLPKDSTSRGAICRNVDAEEIQKRPLLLDREYSIDELWENYAYFCKSVIPAAEEAGVRLALHPNDPPIKGAGGIPFLIKSTDDFKKALKIGNSEYLGMEFCAGCWLEGGKKFGDVINDFKYFSNEGKIFVVHFRNVSSPLPVFKETFIDNGYMNMYLLAKAIVEANYSQSITLDHVPEMIEPYGKGASLSYNMGYMRAMFDRAYDEKDRGN